MSRKIKKAMANLIACKAEGICTRDKIASLYLTKRVEAYERRMQTINEHYRAEIDLPKCPPLCLTDENI